MDILVWDILKWFLIIVGHLGIWCSLYSRIHATAWPRTHRKLSEKATLLVILLPMVWVLTILIGRQTLSLDSIRAISQIAYWYGIGCLFISSVFVLLWAHRQLTYRRPNSVVSASSENLNIGKRVKTPLLHGSWTRLLGSLPINQIQTLTVERKTFRLPNCPDQLDGLKICQLSDLHFTGQLGPEYYHEVVREANAFEPDLIFITGDIIDKIQCIDWIGEVLGNLSATLGIFYVLGNHDLRIRNESMLRSRLADQGFLAASGSWHVVQKRGATILLSGNELPWFRDAQNLPLEPATAESTGPCLKILLSHSPDQAKWAQQYKFDLMFCGHTHGGQIRFPIVGPVVAPSNHGVRYCAGTFQMGEMLMHVSRGISGDDPIRINCPPELGLFTLEAWTSSNKNG